MATVAQKTTDMDRIKYCLNKINDSSTHLLGVINDILDMSKIEINHLELSFTEFVFEKMLLRIIDVMRFKIEEKNIVLSMYCAPEMPYSIYSDEQRLAQVIMNLLSNAVKFTPRNGTITMRADVDYHEADEYTLRISCKDTGIGISEEQKPRLFKVFSQADSSISRQYGGTGLGLVISETIVNMMGGKIWFDSTEGKGTTFTFTMKTTACKLKPAVKFQRDEVRVLVVDDMPDVLTGFSFYTEQLGVMCTTAQSAAEASELLEKQDFDIIFVDWKMPETDGLTFIKNLEKSVLDKMVVVMISAADWSDIEKDAKSAGINDFISKPILMPIIEEILDKYSDRMVDGKIEANEDFSNKTILIVDDVEINREILISLLEPTGISIVCADHGKDAIDKYLESDGSYDLIFMDVQMPVMDGYEATEKIRASNLKDARRLPIVAMTANVFKEDVERCLASGMNDHLGKPVNIEDIIAKIKRWT